MTQRTCAGCAATIHQDVNPVPSHWYSIGRLFDGTPARNYTCETQIENGLLLWALYHYVEGETQRTFVRPDVEGSH